MAVKSSLPGDELDDPSEEDVTGVRVGEAGAGGEGGGEPGEEGEESATQRKVYVGVV